jgi:hypothetical protein
LKSGNSRTQPGFDLGGIDASVLVISFLHHPDPSAAG